MTMTDFKESVFSTDILIAKPNVPVFVTICVLALVGSALFGIFFGRQEAKNVHLRERASIVKNFAVVMEGKDTQINDLSGVLIEAQRSQKLILREIKKTNDIVAIYLDAHVRGETMSVEDRAKLREHVKEIQDRLDSVQ